MAARATRQSDERGSHGVQVTTRRIPLFLNQVAKPPLVSPCRVPATAGLARPVHGNPTSLKTRPAPCLPRRSAPSLFNVQRKQKWTPCSALSPPSRETRRKKKLPL